MREKNQIQPARNSSITTKERKTQSNQKIIIMQEEATDNARALEHERRAEGEGGDGERRFCAPLFIERENGNARFVPYIRRLVRLTLTATRARTVQIDFPVAWAIMGLGFSRGLVNERASPGCVSIAE